MIDAIRKAGQIETSIYLQDHKDREATELYGIQEQLYNHHCKRVETPLKVNHACAQCSANPDMIRKAFKIACLTYRENRVMHEGTLYSREELCQQRVNLLTYDGDEKKKAPHIMLRQETD